MKTLLSIILAISSSSAMGQSLIATTGMPAPQLMWPGVPSMSPYSLCSATNLPGALVIDTELSPMGSRLRTCDNAPGTWGWHQLATSILGTTVSIGGSILAVGACTTPPIMTTVPER